MVQFSQHYQLPQFFSIDPSGCFLGREEAGETGRRFSPSFNGCSCCTCSLMTTASLYVSRLHGIGRFLWWLQMVLFTCQGIRTPSSDRFRIESGHRDTLGDGALSVIAGRSPAPAAFFLKPPAPFPRSGPGLLNGKEF
jgi:hypothetical protein